MTPTYDLLKTRIHDRYGTISKFCRKVGLSDSAMSHILSGKNTMTQYNMVIFAEKLDIPHNQFYDYFFT